MSLPNWKDLPLFTRRSKKKMYELIKESIDALEEERSQSEDENNDDVENEDDNPEELEDNDESEE